MVNFCEFLSGLWFLIQRCNPYPFWAFTNVLCNIVKFPFWEGICLKSLYLYFFGCWMWFSAHIWRDGRRREGDCVACSTLSPKTALGMLDFTVTLLWDFHVILAWCVRIHLQHFRVWSYPPSFQGVTCLLNLQAFLDVVRLFCFVFEKAFTCMVTVVDCFM